MTFERRWLFPKSDLLHKLLVDSKKLYDIISTLYDSKEYRFSRTVAQGRTWFECSDLDALNWLPGRLIVSDDTKMRNLQKW